MPYFFYRFSVGEILLNSSLIFFTENAIDCWMTSVASTRAARIANKGITLTSVRTSQAFVGAPFMIGAGFVLLAISVSTILIVWMDRVSGSIGWW